MQAIRTKAGFRRLRTTALLTTPMIVLTIAGAFAVSAAAAPSATPAESAPTTLALSPAADTYVFSQEANKNYGTAKTLQLSRNVYHGMVRFGLPSLPAGAIVSSAVLRLYSDQTLSGNVVVTKGSNAWTESATTYANAPAWNPPALDGVTPEMVARFFEPVWPAWAHPLRHLG